MSHLQKQTAGRCARLAVVVFVVLVATAGTAVAWPWWCSDAYGDCQGFDSCFGEGFNGIGGCNEVYCLEFGILTEMECYYRWQV